MDVEQMIKTIIEKCGLSREEIKKMIDDEIQEFSGLIDEEGALTIVAKKLDVNLKENMDNATLIPDQKIKSLQVNANVSVVGRIVDIGDKREYTRKEGTRGSFFTLVVEDTSGGISCMVWEPNVQILSEPGFTKNEVVRIVNGNVKNARNGGLELHIGNKSRIQLNPDNVDFTMVPPIRNEQSQITQIRNLNLSIFSANVEGIITSISPAKTFNKKTDNSEGKRASIQLEDDTGSVFITFWNEDTAKVDPLKLRSKVQITNLHPKANFRDKSKVDLTCSSTTEITVVEEGENQVENSSDTDIIPIQTLIDKNGTGNIEGAVQDMEAPRTINLKDGTSKQIQTIILADESAAVRFNFWGDQIIPDLQIGDSLRLSNIYIRLNNFSNQQEANLTKQGKIEKLEKKIVSEHKLALNTRLSSKSSDNTADTSAVSRVSIKQITAESNYQFKGTIIKEINKITVFQACEKCRRKIDNCQCSPRGKPVNRIIANAIVDDENDTIRITFMGDQAERFLNDTSDNVKKIIDEGNLTEYLKQKSQDLLGKELILTGKAKYSQFSNGYEVNIMNFEPLDPEKEAQQLLSILEE